MTSNIGAEHLTTGQNMGFLANTAPFLSFSQLKKLLSPELINRIDEIIAFSPLDVESLEKIARNIVDKGIIRAKEKGINIQITDEVISSFARRAFEKKQGARPLRRIIEEEFLTQIAGIALSSCEPQSIKCILYNDIPSFMHI